MEKWSLTAIRLRASRRVTAHARQRLSHGATLNTFGLLRSKMDGQIVDTPKVVADRYKGCVTTFRVKFDAGLGNSISIRGNQSPLSWQSGQLARWTPGNVWVAEVRGMNGPFECKTLINDQNWESTQGNRTGAACQVNEITPKF
jgi:hypothetical protein